MQSGYVRLFLFAIVAIGFGCSARECKLSTLENGVAIMQNADGILKLSFECNPSYYLVGRSYSLCGSDYVPICKKSQCTIPDVENAVVGSINIDNSVIVDCNDGFTLAGDSRAYCNGTHWDRALGSCLDKKSIPLSCDFETDMCGWTNDDWMQCKWIRSSSTKLFRLNGGPSNDHTTMHTSSGHFMMLAEWEDNMKIATLMSPVYPAELSKDACFRFWYYAYGDGGHFLYVYVKPESNDSYILHGKHVMKLQGDGGKVWKMGLLNLAEIGENFQIVITVKVPCNIINKEGVAIDDVKLTRGSECSLNKGHLDAFLE